MYPFSFRRSSSAARWIGTSGWAADNACTPSGALYLASDEASFVNGAVLSVDGGLVIGT